MECSTGHYLRQVQPNVKESLWLKVCPSRKFSAALSELRTGHSQLNESLHRFGLRDDPKCRCGVQEETAEHFLLHCPVFSALPSGVVSRKACPPHVTIAISHNVEFCILVVDFLRQTGRFQYFR